MSATTTSASVAASRDDPALGLERHGDDDESRRPSVERRSRARRPSVAARRRRRCRRRCRRRRRSPSMDRFYDARRNSNLDAGRRNDDGRSLRADVFCAVAIASRVCSPSARASAASRAFFVLPHGTRNGQTATSERTRTRTAATRRATPALVRASISECRCLAFGNDRQRCRGRHLEHPLVCRSNANARVWRGLVGNSSSALTVPRRVAQSPIQRHDRPNCADRVVGAFSRHSSVVGSRLQSSVRLIARLSSSI